MTRLTVDRLPPGRRCVAAETYEVALDAHPDALRHVREMGRRAVRTAAAELFATDRIADAVVATPGEARNGASER